MVIGRDHVTPNEISDQVLVLEMIRCEPHIKSTALDVRRVNRVEEAFSKGTEGPHHAVTEDGVDVMDVLAPGRLEQHLRVGGRNLGGVQALGLPDDRHQVGRQRLRLPRWSGRLNVVILGDLEVEQPVPNVGVEAVALFIEADATCRASGGIGAPLLDAARVDLMRIGAGADEQYGLGAAHPEVDVLL